ncbi:MAG: hypothetical protein WBI07_10600 [Mobilitalea sp.]
MKNRVATIAVFGKIALFCFLIYLVIVGQKNLGPVQWVAKALNTTNVRPIGVCFMIVALIGLLCQLYCYNRKYQ